MYWEIYLPLQALSLSDNTLTGLGVTRESVDSTAGAAQVQRRFIRCVTFYFCTEQYPIGLDVRLVVCSIE